MECKFCDELKWFVEHNREHNPEVVAAQPNRWKAHHRYRLRLYMGLVINNENDTSGSLTTGKYHIKFCPLCGRRIKESELDDAAKRD